ncbi:hypothetical protein MIND_00302100 [Mycena indigotica]|uniref:Uncharacterized protein n=1 Tax=Mycena indigotica TaxID=2126181 RepID=A0A8H6WC28_9AGAR|nr:uncharacterized protein MIND_00302100 [Mycena indigotica]KAF7309318.1 hypothetical protein MIND_00302100 [Mycena indigotica]
MPNSAQTALEASNRCVFLIIDPDLDNLVSTGSCQLTSWNSIERLRTGTMTRNSPWLTVMGPDSQTSAVSSVSTTPQVDSFVLPLAAVGIQAHPKTRFHRTFQISGGAEWCVVKRV